MRILKLMQNEGGRRLCIALPGFVSGISPKLIVRTDDGWVGYKSPRRRCTNVRRCNKFEISSRMALGKWTHKRYIGTPVPRATFHRWIEKLQDIRFKLFDDNRE